MESLSGRPSSASWWPGRFVLFVLSGFILTCVYDNRLRRRDVPRFWLTRWARLWPLHIVCLAIATLFFHVGVEVGSDPTGRSSCPSLVAQFLLLQSWLPINYWISDLNGVSWSISTELFFDLIFPLLLLGNRNRFYLKIITVFAVSFGILFCAQHLFDIDGMRLNLRDVSQFCFNFFVTNASTHAADAPGMIVMKHQAVRSEIDRAVAFGCCSPDPLTRKQQAVRAKLQSAIAQFQDARPAAVGEVGAALKRKKQTKQEQKK